MCMRVESLVYVQYNKNTLPVDQINRLNIMGVSAFPAAVSSVLGSHGVLWWFQETSRLSSAGQSWCFIFSFQRIPQHLFIQTQMHNVCHEWISKCKVVMLNTTTMVHILSIRLFKCFSSWSVSWQKPSASLCCCQRLTPSIRPSCPDQDFSKKGNHSWFLPSFRFICLGHLWADSWPRSLQSIRTGLPGCIRWYCVTHLVIRPSSIRHGQQTGNICDSTWFSSQCSRLFSCVNSTASGWCQLSCWRKLSCGTLPKDLWIQKWQMQLTLWSTE